MGLRQRWASCAVARAHALVVEVPGWWATRVAVEQDLVRRGWRPALSPADADVLVVCGEPGERLADAVDAVWGQLPGPRARVAVSGTDVAEALDEAGRQLADENRQHADARDRQDPITLGTGRPHPDGGDHDMAGDDHGDMAPAGIPLAGGDGDRDGLEMDVLHVPLGPVLAHWPPGLVLQCALHGDVVAGADVEVLEGRGFPPPPVASALPVRDTATACDAAARLLAVAGWDDAAAAAFRIRDLVLTRTVDGGPLPQLDRLRARVAGSWSLRWLLRGLGTVGTDAAVLPAAHRGDVHDRLVAMLDRARAGLRGEPAGAVADPDAVLRTLPDLVAGLDLAALRLVVASLDPDTAGAVRRERARA